MVTLNRVVALGMVRGPSAALAELAATESELDGHYRVDAVRAHLLERAGDRAAAREHYARAAGRTLSVPERRYLSARAAALS
jgi:predicted RNA polymerase sigma factor